MQEYDEQNAQTQNTESAQSTSTDEQDFVDSVDSMEATSSDTESSSPNEQDSHADNSQNLEAKEDYKFKYEELKDQYVRAFADFENTKKRLERDKNQSLEYAYERLMNDLLPVLDTLEKALESAKSNPQAQAIAEGLSLTLDS